MWDKPKLNFVIDSLMFLCMTAIIGIGLLIKYVLIPGQERWAVYGRNVDLFLFGLNRHDWGTIHLYIGLTLVGLITLHIILHWHLIPGLYKRLIASKGARTGVAWVFVLIGIVFLSFPLFVSPDVKEIEAGAGRVHEYRESALDIRGYMTLKEVAEKYGVPVAYLKTKLNLPESTPEQERLGRLRRAHGFRMSELEKIIVEYRGAKP